VATIPDDLERVVMHALAKRPEDRPANAGEFRKELLEIADSLGLEHSAVTVLPDYEALRNHGVESPSGRLVIDIARLREQGIFSSVASEVTLVGNKKVPQAESAIATPGPITRVTVTAPSHSKKILLAVILLVAAVVFTGGVGIGYFFFFSQRANTAASSGPDTKPSPMPTSTPSLTSTPAPTPTQSPSAQRKASPSPSPSPSPKKKGNSVLDKVKRILTKPF
jgi:hypothetical protein